MINFYKKPKRILTDEEYKEVIKLIYKNDKFAVTDLYESYKNFMYAAIKKYTFFDEDEKDFCVDLAFTRIIKREPLNKLDRQIFQKYLWVYCRQTAARHIRDNYSRNKAKFNNEVTSYHSITDNHKFSDEWINNVDSMYDLEFGVIRKQQMDEINRVINSYSHKKAVECFKLACFNDLTNHEVAKVTGLKYSTVCTFNCNVRTYLKKRGLTYIDCLMENN